MTTKPAEPRVEAEIYTFEYIVDQQNYPKAYGRKFVVYEAYAALRADYENHKEHLRKAVNRCDDQNDRIEQLEEALNKVNLSSLSNFKDIYAYSEAIRNLASKALEKNGG